MFWNYQGLGFLGKAGQQLECAGERVRMVGTHSGLKLVLLVP